MIRVGQGGEGEDALNSAKATIVAALQKELWRPLQLQAGFQLRQHAGIGELSHPA